MGNYKMSIISLKIIIMLCVRPVLRKIELVLNDAISVLHDGLVEVEDGVGHQRVGGQLGGGQPGVP